MTLDNDFKLGQVVNYQKGDPQNYFVKVTIKYFYAPVTMH